MSVVKVVIHTDWQLDFGLFARPIKSGIMGPLYTFIGPQKSDLKNPENLDLRMGASNN